jgi:hypothetical protein
MSKSETGIHDAQRKCLSRCLCGSTQRQSSLSSSKQKSGVVFMGSLKNQTMVFSERNTMTLQDLTQILCPPQVINVLPSCCSFDGHTPTRESKLPQESMASNTPLYAKGGNPNHTPPPRMNSTKRKALASTPPNDAEHRTSSPPETSQLAEDNFVRRTKRKTK